MPEDNEELVARIASLEQKIDRLASEPDPPRTLAHAQARARAQIRRGIEQRMREQEGDGDDE